MKKAKLKKISIAVALLILILLGSTAYCFESNTEEFSDKISPDLISRYVTGDTVLRVQVWFRDIDHDVAVAHALETVGMSEDEWADFCDGENENCEMVDSFIKAKRQKNSELYSEYNGIFAEMLFDEEKLNIFHIIHLLSLQD